MADAEMPMVVNNKADAASAGSRAQSPDEEVEQHSRGGEQRYLHALHNRRGAMAFMVVAP